MSDISTFIAAELNDGNSVASQIRAGLLSSFGKARLMTTVAYSSGPQTLAGNADIVACDTGSGSFTVNLPAAPLDGDTYVFYKAVAGNTLTIGRNGKNIDFVAADKTITAALGVARLTWSTTLNSWLSW
jgi:hypothetical protein